MRKLAASSIKLNCCYNPRVSVAEFAYTFTYEASPPTPTPTATATLQRRLSPQRDTDSDSYVNWNLKPKSLLEPRQQQ